MQQQLEKLTTSDDRIAVVALDEISEPQNREEIAALAYEFWQRWTIRRGLVPRGTGNFGIKEQDEKQVEIQHTTGFRCEVLGGGDASQDEWMKG
jgi:hypothetical protein